jgi:hypothetical protein
VTNDADNGVSWLSEFSKYRKRTVTQTRLFRSKTQVVTRCQMLKFAENCRLPARLFVLVRAVLYVRSASPRGVVSSEIGLLGIDEALNGRVDSVAPVHLRAVADELREAVGAAC